VVPKLRQVAIREWYAEARAAVGDDPDLPVWVGEIYLELHRGTLTSQGRTKHFHRRAERSLITAETVASMATLLGAPLAPSMEEHWRVVLRNEFHDVLPGSSIREVYELAEAELAAVVEAGRAAAAQSLEAIVEHSVARGQSELVIIVTPILVSPPARVISPDPLPGGQRVEDGYVIAPDVTPPGLSAVVLADTAPPPGLAVTDRSLENALVRVTLNDDGTLASVWDKRAGREALDGRGNQIWAYVDKPRSWDAWDIDESYPRQGEELTAGTIEVTETGQHRAAIRVTRRFRDSEIVQHLRLWANSARLDIKTDVSWHDRRILVKARFPLAVRADHATFECAHGVIRRPTHRNTSWDVARFEVAAHRFADLSEQGYGVALLNDGKYGHHVRGSELGLSLLRAPVYPDPFADEGHQSFTYALYPHAGDWLTGGVLAEAEALNQPLLARRVMAEGPSSFIAVELSGLQVALSGFKPAEDGSGLILRTYEPAGGRGEVEVRLPDGWRLGNEVTVLEDGKGAADRRFLPFKLHSWKIEGPN
jgi:alpha-mannosidase